MEITGQLRLMIGQLAFEAETKQVERFSTGGVKLVLEDIKSQASFPGALGTSNSAAT